MSFSGGVFSINTTGQPVVSGTTISASVFNALTADLATGLSTCMLKDGTQTATASIDFAQGLSVATNKFVVASTGALTLTPVAGSSFVATTFTPAISIGGSPPTSYTTQVGNYMQIGVAGNGRVFFGITVRLNVAGAATGVVTFTGLPVAARAGAATERNVCSVYLTGQSTGLTTESIWATVAQGATVIDLWTYTAGAAAAFSIGTLTNSVQFNITGSYPI